METEKTIAELFDSLKTYETILWLDDTKATDKTMGGKWGSPPGELAKEAARMIPKIRQQLLERLDLIKVDTPNNQRTYLLFGFTGENDEAISFIPINDHDQEFKPTIAQCGELSAMFAFCKWELEQRQKEKQV